MRRAVSLLVLALTFGWMQPAQAGGVQPPTAFVEAFVVDAPTPLAGDIVSVRASLVSNNNPVPGVPVTLQVKRYGQDAFHDLITLETSNDGHVTVNLKPRRNFKTRWVFAGNGSYAASSTKARLWLIGSRATLTFSDRTPAVGQSVVVSGRTRPNKAGHTIRVFQGLTRRGGFGPPLPTPTLLGSTTVKPNGHYRLRVHFTETGKQPVFAQVSRGHGNTVGYSRTRVVTVG